MGDSDEAPPPSASSPTRFQARPSWPRRLRSHVTAWVCAQYGRTSIPVLTVAVLTLLVGIANYCLQRSAYNRPELAASGGTINLAADPIMQELNWNNVGSKPARNGVATLFSVGEDGTSRQQIAQSQIFGVGNIVAVHLGAVARFTYQNRDVVKWPFVVCVIYYDEGGNQYQQAYRFRRVAGGASTSIGLEFLSEPKYTDLCPPTP
jgi:hypothetical protein